MHLQRFLGEAISREAGPVLVDETNNLGVREPGEDHLARHYCWVECVVHCVVHCVLRYTVHYVMHYAVRCRALQAAARLAELAGVELHVAVGVEELKDVPQLVTRQLDSHHVEGRAELGQVERACGGMPRVRERCTGACGCERGVGGV